jgi:predicted acylesterase/phospholipase RssA
MANSMTTAARRNLVTASSSSFGFSGAGFLTCYHLGVAECLLKHGHLLQRGQLPTSKSNDTTTVTVTVTDTDNNNNKDTMMSSPMLTGVSGGALVAAAVSIGIRPEDGMNAMAEIVRRTRSVGGMMDHLRPGYVQY